MSALKWIRNGLKNLGMGGSGTTVSPGLLQSRLAGTTASTTVPPKPKRPMTAYFRFLNEIRPEVAKSNPKLRPPELMKIIGERWTQLDMQSKEKYADGFKSEMVAYQVVLDKYLKSLTQEQRDALDKAKIDKQLRKERLEKKKRIVESGKPKKPPTAFFQFLQTKISPGASVKEYTLVAKKLGPVWKEMSEKEKAPFVSKYTKMMGDYEKAMRQWENEMLKLGNDDLVRSKTLEEISKASNVKSSSKK